MRKLTGTPTSLCLAALMALSCVHSASAQSSYTLTTLKAPGKVGLLSSVNNVFGIDRNDQVVGQASYASGFYFDTNRPYFRVKYVVHLVRWPASSAATVAPIKMIQPSKALNDRDWSFVDLRISPDANKILMRLGLPAVYDVTTKEVTPKMPSDIDGELVSNTGEVAYIPRSWGTFDWGTWSAAGGKMPTPDSANNLGRVMGINSDGVSVGYVITDRYAGKTKAVLWANQQSFTVDDLPGVASSAIAINDADDVLIDRITPATCADGGQNCVRQHQLVMLQQGTSAPLPNATDPDHLALDNVIMNNMGTVVATRGTIKLAYPLTVEQFPVMWKDGQFMDVNDMLRSKGVLPLGAKLTKVLAINDKGSMVAAMSRGSETSVVRLAATP